VWFLVVMTESGGRNNGWSSGRRGISLNGLKAWSQGREREKVADGGGDHGTMVVGRRREKPHSRHPR